MDYWEEHVEIALNEAGLSPATPEQLAIMGGVIESAHEFYGQAMGHDVASSNLHAHNKREQQKKLQMAEKETEQAREAGKKALERSREECRRLAWLLHDLRQENARLRAQS